MKFERGKAYRTRDGKKAVVYETMAEAEQPMVGVVFNGSKGQHATWDEKGRRVDEGILHQDDLVGHYSGETRRLIAWRNGDGIIGLLPEGEKPDPLAFAVRCPWLDEPIKSKGVDHEHKN